MGITAQLLSPTALAAATAPACTESRSCNGAAPLPPVSQRSAPQNAGPRARPAAAALALLSPLMTASAAQALDVTAASALTSDDALLIGGGVAILALAGGLVAVLTRKGYAGDVSPQDALAMLEEKGVVLLDLRDKKDIAENGSPNLKSVRKKSVQVAFELEEDGAFFADPEFAAKVEAKVAAKDKAVLVIDRFGKTGGNAAKVLTKAGYTKVYAVTGGTEGIKGWKESGLPWKKPAPQFSLDLAAVKQAIDSTIKENPNVLPASVGVAALAAGSFLVFTEAEALLEVLGAAAIVNLAVSKLLFAEDRKKTIAQVTEFLDTKVAPQELVDEFKEIGNALTTGEKPGKASSTPKNKSTVESSKAVASKAEAAKPVINEVGTPGKAKPVVNEAGTPGKAKPVINEAGTPGKAKLVVNEAGTPGKAKPAVNEVGTSGKAFEPENGGSSKQEQQLTAASLPAELKEAEGADALDKAASEESYQVAKEWSDVKPTA